VMAEARGLWEELGPHPEAARNQAILLGVIDGAH
jgi:hypothetical protein